MPTSYKHGAYIQEEATSLVTPRLAEATLPVVVGTAPVHRLPEGTAAPVNEPRLVFNLPSFEAQFGKPGKEDNEEDFTLWQMANVYFTRYRAAPVVFVNVYDPEKHETIAAVSKDDIIGNGEDGRTGLKLVDEVYPRFGLTPGLILAPKFAKDPTVAKAIETACTGISGFFRAMGIIEVAESACDLQKAETWLKTNNLHDASGNTIVMYGDLAYNGKTEPGSIHAAGCIAARDISSDGVPFWSPSNTQLEATSLVSGGKPLYLTPEEANYLNGQGICTGLTMTGSLKFWGDQTSAYPEITDVKESFIPIRRMFSWVGNTLLLTSWQFVSAPIRRRLIEQVQDTVNYWLNGLVGRGYILGGRCTFEGADNPTTDLMDGKVRWHVYLTPPTPARELTFILEYDPSYLQTLFQNSNEA